MIEELKNKFTVKFSNNAASAESIQIVKIRARTKKYYLHFFFFYLTIDTQAIIFIS